MDCRSCQGSAAGCRPQRPVPPCMNTNCDKDCRPPRPEFWPRPAGAELPAMTPMPMQPMQSMRPMRPYVSEESGSSGQTGVFPSSTPVGMGYVPMQQWGPVYPADTAFQRGTIFPELDLPFQMGRCQ